MNIVDHGSPDTWPLGLYKCIKWGGFDCLWDYRIIVTPNGAFWLHGETDYEKHGQFMESADTACLQGCDHFELVKGE